MAAANTLPDILPEALARVRAEAGLAEAVILHNDDRNTQLFVMMVLRKVFGYEPEKCYELMMEAHEKGRSVVWVGPLEVAELKADQIRSCGADPEMKAKGAHPLGVSVEPAA